MENKTLKILAVDDNPDNLTCLKEQIREVMPEALTLTTTNGKTAIELAVKEDPDLILLDMVMPVMDGFEVCRSLKSKPILADIPVVFFTAQIRDKENRIKALQAGAETFLNKPIDESELAAQIRAMQKIKAANLEKRTEKERFARMVDSQTHDLRHSYLAMLNLLEDLKSEIEARKKSQEILRISEEQFRSAMDNMLEGCQIIGMDWTYLYLNHTAEIQNRRPNKELLGRKYIEVWPAVIDSPLFSVLDQCRSQRISSQLEYEFVFPDESRGWFNLSIQPIPEGIFILSFDITARKTAEQALIQSELQYRRIFESSQDGILILDYLSRRIMDANPRLLELLGFTLPAIKGKILSEIGLNLDQSFVTDILNDLKTSRYLRFADLPIATQAGSIIHVEFSCSLYSVTNQDIIQCNIRDITERKRNEEELSQYRGQLESLVERRTNDLIAMNIELSSEIHIRRKTENDLQIAKEEAVSANRAKSTFISSMSHEIRTPLNAILGYTQLLMREIDVQSRHYEKLYTIMRSGEHLLSLINDILEFSKIEAGFISYSPHAFRLIDLLKEVESMFRVKTDDKQLGFRLELADDLPDIIITDENKFRQILINLMGNAIKFTLTGSVTLRARIADRPSDPDLPFNLMIEIEDTGTGIAVDDLEKLFIPFAQTEAGINHGGTGLGLALSQQYARMMGGIIKVSSRIGSGSCFTFSLDVTQGESAPGAETVVRQRVIGLKPGSQSLRILIVDDDPDSRNLIRELIQPIGLMVDEASNGSRALEMFHSQPVDLILMDLIMPGMSGYQAIQALRQNDQGCSVPIVAITANAFDEDETLALQLGVNAYLRKPIREDDLFECLGKLLNLDYIYQSRIGSSNGNHALLTDPINSESIILIPHPLAVQMMQSAEMLEHDQLMDEVEQLSRIEPRLAERMMSMLKSYQYEGIIAILKKRIDSVL